MNIYQNNFFALLPATMRRGGQSFIMRLPFAQRLCPEGKGLKNSSGMTGKPGVTLERDSDEQQDGAHCFNLSSKRVWKSKKQTKTRIQPMISGRLNEKPDVYF